jgi:ribosomal protein S18 acetylase RimI-like enzyme
MNITFRKAETIDIPLIYALAEETWNEHYITIVTQDQINYMLNLMYSETALEKQMTNGHEFTFVFVENEPAGYISIHQEKESEYFLNKFYILKRFRNHKIGEKLLKYREDKLAGKLKIMRLFVNRENFKSINFYFKTGFIIEKIIDQPIGENYYMNDFVMMKKYNQ